MIEDPPKAFKVFKHDQAAIRTELAQFFKNQIFMEKPPEKLKQALAKF